MYNRLMEEKQKKYFEYVAWLEKQPSVIEFAKHYITTYNVENYFDANNRESVEFIASLFAQAYTHEDGYKFNKETKFDKILTERTFFRIERALKYNDDGDEFDVTISKDGELLYTIHYDREKRTVSEYPHFYSFNDYNKNKFNKALRWFVNKNRLVLEFYEQT